MSLVAAGSFLVAATARNRVRQAIRKLREPRYLIGAAAMGLYLWSFFGRAVLRNQPGAEGVSVESTGAVLRLLLELGVTGLGLVTLFVTWTLGSDRLSFSFTEAEVTWLLSGPVSRRGIVRYKVAVGLLRTLLSAAVVTLVSRRVTGGRFPFLLGTWLGFSILWLQGAGASLVRIGWQRAGRSGLRRAVLGAVLLGGAGLLVALGVREAGPLPAPDAWIRAKSWDDVLPQLIAWHGALSDTPALHWLLVPARAFVSATLARTLGEAVAPLGVLTLLALLLLGFVLLLDAPFEEAAIASAERRAKLQARKRRRGVPLPRAGWVPVLGSLGAPELALTWKNWVALRRVYGARLGILLLMLAGGIGFSVWGMLQRRAGGPNWLLLGSGVAAGFALLTVFFGPMSFRTDLRADLRRLDVLRTLPLSGVQVVRGELLAPALLLAATQLALLVLALGLSAGSHIQGFSFATRAAWTAGLVLLLPAATAAILVVQNAAALVFPSLLVEDEERAPRGVEATGTRLLNLGATLLLLAIGFVPGALLGLVVGAVGSWVGLGPLAYTAGCAAAAAVLAVEVFLAIAWMGHGLERLDPTTA
jgi:hypothetical protein